ncbi:unnamed protein product, partial [Aureobasidium pullulans]
QGCLMFSSVRNATPMPMSLRMASGRIVLLANNIFQPSESPDMKEEEGDKEAK